MLEEALVVCAPEPRGDCSLWCVSAGAPCPSKPSAYCRTEHTLWMRAMEPLRSWMRSGGGRRSRILDCSVDGPRGAKLWASAVAAGDGGGESAPVPWPGDDKLSA